MSHDQLCTLSLPSSLFEFLSLPVGPSYFICKNSFQILDLFETAFIRYPSV